MEITWGAIALFFLVLVVGAFIIGSIDVALEDRKRRREQAKREEYQQRGQQESDRFDKGIT